MSGQGRRKRVTLKKWGQSLLATTVCAGLLGLTSCSVSNTIDYLYMLSSKNNPGQINVYRVDSQTGALTQIPNSPYPAGRNPVGLVIAPNGLTLYEINHDDNTVEIFGIGTDAKLYPQHTYTTPGSEPVAIAINPAGTLLFVVDYYQPNYTDLNPGPGAIVVFPINADGSLGTAGPVSQTLPNGQTANYYPVDTAPSAVGILPSGNSVYVAETLAAAGNGCAAGQGGLVALSVSSAGVVAPIAGSPYCAGQTPSAIASHPGGSYLYVADSAQNDLLGYNVAADGSLTSFASGPIAAGSAPSSIAIEPRGLFMYITNRSAPNIESYSIASGSGVPTSTGQYPTGAFPQCVIVEPNLGRFVYSADFGGAGSTGYQLDPTTGLLTATYNSPYAGTGQATCLAATTHNKTGESK
jgi:6-phosphogluconolactonase (cycloisomerase 2 family)